MAISAKPTTYTVNLAHAKCPNHLYMLDDSTGGTTVADGVGSLDLTADSTGMWNTDATYGRVLRFDSASSQKALSGTSFSASSGLCMVVIVKTASATNPVADQVCISPGHSTTFGIYGGIRYPASTGVLVAEVDTGLTTNGARINSDYYDGTWHVIAFKSNNSTGSDGLVHLSLDGAAWTGSGFSGAGDQNLSAFNRIGLGCSCRSSPTHFFSGDILAAMVYVDDYSTWDDTWIASLYADPWQFLSTTVKKLKLLAHPSAANATGVSGWVVNSAEGSLIGKFTGASFEASLEAGEAVLKVPVSEFGGESLSTSDTPYVVAWNSTYGTSRCAAEIIEE